MTSLQAREQMLAGLTVPTVAAQQFGLDEMALEAAKLYAKSETLLVLDSGIAGLIRSYLSALPSSPVSELVDDLKPRYTTKRLRQEIERARENDTCRIAALEAQLAERGVELREARRLISGSHKRAVKHDNCEKPYCPICEGGLFVCADCGAAEIETEQRLCTGPALEATPPAPEVMEVTEAMVEAALDAFGRAFASCLAHPTEDETIGDARKHIMRAALTAAQEAGKP